MGVIEQPHYEVAAKRGEAFDQAYRGVDAPAHRKPLVNGIPHIGL